ncbi:MAG: carbamoyltransferase [Spirochaetales bacterium]|nr:carbamoyltransferase [Spirochaetales bacterium]
MTILGISALYHDSAAALIKDGEVIAAAQEERFTRKKHDPDFPVNAIKYCIEEGKIGKKDLDAVVFYDKPIKKFARILTTYFSVAPKGLRSALMAIPVWMKVKLWVPLIIEDTLEKLDIELQGEPYFAEHHQAHAASAFFPSPFEKAAILTIDGVGEWATSTIGKGNGNRIEIMRELKFPHSLGLLYSAFTYFTGFRVNSGEYKLMGLAPYGEPRYTELIRDKLIDLKEDGSFRLNLKYFGYLDGLTMTNRRFNKLFDGPPRRPESEITQREMDLARSIQDITEEIVLRMAKHAARITGEKKLCLAGGVALNCVANGKLHESGVFDDIWIQPASGDAGGALGAAMMLHYHIQGNSRKPDGIHDKMKGSYLGPGFSDSGLKEFIDRSAYPAKKITGTDWAGTIAGLIDKGKVIGLFNGRMEFGPRALGSRSIIGDPRSPKMQSIMNLKIKFRESFRPFAPSCLEEDVEDYFDFKGISPYMLLIANVKKDRIKNTDPNIPLREKINQVRSDIPAVTHVDYTARLQTVSNESNPEYHSIIKAFKELTGYGIIINTSFNIRGEPIVCTPADAYNCFMATEMDYLVLGPYLLDKKEQPDRLNKDKWKIDQILD